MQFSLSSLDNDAGNIRTRARGDARVLRMRALTQPEGAGPSSLPHTPGGHSMIYRYHDVTKSC